MRSKRVAIAVALLVGGVVVYQGYQESLNERDLGALRRRESQREQQHENSVPDPVAAFDALARQGKGQRVPEDLIVEPDPKGFWFIGKRGSDVGVEIPFAPGRLPAATPTAKAVHENPGFMGADACRGCHQEKYESFVHTAHHLTSRPAGPGSIAGSFDPPENVMHTYHPDVRFTMIERDGEFFQRVSFFDWHFEVPFDIVIGSSKMAQTFLYWHGDALYEMNVTYLKSIDDWINSPGFVDGDAAYARPIGSGCVECHTTYVDFRGPPNHYTRDSLIFGISCERCHGPGREHVEYHAAHPNEKFAKHVTVPSDLPRKQSLFVCSQCHSGIPQLKGLPYQFRPGDDLADHYHPLDEESGNSVHTSNQLKRLVKSECFIQTEMTCVDCHNPHHNERGQSQIFSARCLKCHDADHCGMSERLGDRLTENCIDCHMPSRAGDHLRLNTSEGTVFPPLRDHYIRVDLLATETYLNSLTDAEQN